MSQASHYPTTADRSFAAPAAGVTTTPAYQAFATLYTWYIVLPIVAGADKFFHLLCNWDMYLAPRVTEILDRTIHMSGHTFMLIVGVIEIIAGVLVAFVPRVGAIVVGLWLIGIIVNLMLFPGFFDVAVRDFGLALGAFALAMLSRQFSRWPATTR
jgi:hypothetical protein